MMERKFTDNEIKTTLRRCADHACYRCTEYGKEYCRETIASLAWDLIFRYESEIERLNKEVDRLSQCVLYHDGNIADAIKEFAERLKKEACYPYVESDMRIVTVDDIDNIVKEMTESDVE